MDREGLNGLPAKLTDSDIRKLGDYAKTRQKAFVSMWTPDQVLVQRFAEVAEELLRVKTEQEWCDQQKTSPELTPQSRILSNPNLWRWQVPYYVAGVLNYGPEADTPSQAVRNAMTQSGK